MTLPVAPSSISFSQLACEMGNNCQNISLRTYSQCAALSSPDAISELYGKTCTIVYGTGTWSSGGNLGTARYNLTGTGTQNNALTAGGLIGTSNTNSTEKYNGTSWTTSGVGVLSISRRGPTLVGTQNSALAFLGVCGTGTITTCNEEFNGSNWSVKNALGTVRYAGGGVGSPNTALAFGGYRSTPSRFVSCTESYNGTNWTSSGISQLGIARYSFGYGGTQNDAIGFGGTQLQPNALGCTEQYNGSNWSSRNSLITPSYWNAGAADSSNNALSFGGRIQGGTTVGTTQEYNGSVWCTGNNMSNSRWTSGGAGNRNSGLAFGGLSSTDTYLASTEEYTKPFCIRLC